MKSAQLKQLCTRLGLSQTGSKKTLIDRIRVKQEPEPEPEPEPEEPVVSEKVSKSSKVTKRVPQFTKQEPEEPAVPQEFSDVRALMGKFKTELGDYLKVFQMKQRRQTLHNNDYDQLIDFYNQIFTETDDAVCDLLDDILDIYGSSVEYNTLSKSYTNLRDRTKAKIEKMIGV